MFTSDILYFDRRKMTFEKLGICPTISCSFMPPFLQKSVTDEPSYNLPGLVSAEVSRINYNKKLGNSFIYKLHLCQVLPCCIKQIVTSHFSSLCVVPQLDKHFCKCYKMGSYAFRQTDTSFMCRVGREMNSAWNGKKGTMLSIIWGFRYHEKPQVLLDPCSVHEKRDQRQKTPSYPPSCFLLLPLPQRPKVFHVPRTRQSKYCTIRMGRSYLFPLSLAKILVPKRSSILDSSTIQAEQPYIKKSAASLLVIISLPQVLSFWSSFHRQIWECFSPSLSCSSLNPLSECTLVSAHSHWNRMIPQRDLTSNVPTLHAQSHFSVTVSDRGFFSLQQESFLSCFLL